jgi:hypothetical protein
MCLRRSRLSPGYNGHSELSDIHMISSRFMTYSLSEKNSRLPSLPQSGLDLPIIRRNSHRPRSLLPVQSLQQCRSFCALSLEAFAHGVVDILGYGITRLTRHQDCERMHCKCELTQIFHIHIILREKGLSTVRGMLDTQIDSLGPSLREWATSGYGFKA